MLALTTPVHFFRASSNLEPHSYHPIQYSFLILNYFAALSILLYAIYNALYTLYSLLLYAIYNALYTLYSLSILRAAATAASATSDLPLKEANNFL